MAEVVSVNISLHKGEQKHPVPEIQLKLCHGIIGDAMPETGTARSPSWQRKAWTPCAPPVPFP